MELLQTQISCEAVVLAASLSKKLEGANGNKAAATLMEKTQLNMATMYHVAKNAAVSGSFHTES
jgi:hypothetical protein